MRAAIALLRASHPGPALAVTLITTVFALSLQLEPGRILVIGVAALLNQIAVGLSNDWLDQTRDTASGRRSKPLVDLSIGRRTVGITAAVCLVACLALPFTLGILCALAHLLAVGSGLAYNLGLKATALSPLPYAMSFALLPIVVSLAQSTPEFPPAPIVIAGALLGIAAHFGNALPDIADDRATGVWGLPQRLTTAQCGLILVFAMLAGSTVAMLAAATYLPLVGFGGLAAAVLLAALTAVLLRLAPHSRWIFVATIVSALICVTGLSVSFVSGAS